jgi:hypothetical protein
VLALLLWLLPVALLPCPVPAHLLVALVALGAVLLLVALLLWPVAMLLWLQPAHLLVALVLWLLLGGMLVAVGPSNTPSGPRGMTQQVHDHQWPSDLLRQLLTHLLAELQLGNSENSTMMVALGAVLLLVALLLWPVAMLLSLRRAHLLVSLVLWLLLEVARQCLLEEVRVEVARQCVLEEVRVEVARQCLLEEVRVEVAE